MILVLEGTAEARELAAGLHAAGVPVISSLAWAGRPAAAAGGGRGSGGSEVRRRRPWIVEYDVEAVVNATHPFAGRSRRSSGTPACEHATAAEAEIAIV